MVRGRRRVPERLLLEFTEDVLLRNNNELLKTLKKLTAIGVQLALDNFGAGNSSISNLTRLPISKIKIDQSFIHKMESDKDIGAIVDMIVGLGKSLGVTISAGGVETESQAQYLRQIGCNEVQGFLFGRPQPKIIHQIPTAPPASDSSGFLVSLPNRGEASNRAGASAECTLVELETEPVVLSGADETQRVCELTGLLPGKPALSSPARAPAEPDDELQEQESNPSLVG